MEDVVQFLKFVGDLKKVKRTGWVIAGIENSESVADHSFRLAILSLVLAKKLGVDREKLVKMALIDDLAECIVGDVVTQRGLKTVASEEEKLEKETKAVKTIFSNLDNGDEYLQLWQEAQEGKTKEAIVLKELDKLEMAVQALEYKGEAEDEKLEEFWTNAQAHIKNEQLIKILGQLKKQKTANS